MTQPGIKHISPRPLVNTLLNWATGPVNILENVKKKIKVGNCSQERPEGFLFNSYYTEL